MFVIKLKKPPKKILLCIISPQRTLSKKFRSLKEWSLLLLDELPSNEASFTTQNHSFKQQSVLKEFACDKMIPPREIITNIKTLMQCGSTQRDVLADKLILLLVFECFTDKMSL